MKMLRGIFSLHKSKNIIGQNRIRLLPVTRTFCDKIDKSEANNSQLTTDIKSEEQKIIAKIHEDYKSERLIKIETSDNSVGDVNKESSELSEKYVVKFESRLDHFRKTGFIASPQMINVPVEPKINPVVDKAIEIIKGKIIGQICFSF